MRSIHAKASSVLLIAGLMTMMGGPIVAAAPHEVCNVMRHGCDRVDALASCCCGDRSDNNPLLLPTGHSDTSNVSHPVIAAIPAVLPAVTVALPCKGPLSSARPPDLRILFSDLRI